MRTVSATSPTSSDRVEIIATQHVDDLLQQVRNCRICEAALDQGVNPVVQINPAARVLIIGQAPGSKVHASGIPWDDPSGDRLRQWLGLDAATFYNPHEIAIMPMGFCYPGKGASGDLAPRKECAPHWHRSLLDVLPNIELTLLIGQYAQKYYLPKTYPSLTERVMHWREFAPQMLPLPHPSPRNRLWFKKNPWFERELVPWLQERIQLLNLP